MKSNTHIAIVLDRSGSMRSMADEIIGGFNAFLKDQKAVPGHATLTLVQFDHDIDRLATFKPIAEVAELTDKTYEPRGNTKLYDAIGLTVTSTQQDIEKAAEKPDKVLVVIITDGQENSSQEYTTGRIRELLTERQAAGWEFTFLGANQDAILSAQGIGLRNAAANMTYAATPVGAMNMMASLSDATMSFRCSAKGTAFAYSADDRAAQTIDPAAAYASTRTAVFSEHGSAAGKIGGPARADALSPKRRSQIASNAAKARWSGKSV